MPHRYSPLTPYLAGALGGVLLGNVRLPMRVPAAVLPNARQVLLEPRTIVRLFRDGVNLAAQFLAGIERASLGTLPFHREGISLT